MDWPDGILDRISGNSLWKPEPISTKRIPTFNEVKDKGKVVPVLNYLSTTS
jgi:hypothetical protein